jgi:outer membrane protein assembly factor BamB
MAQLACKGGGAPLALGGTIVATPIGFGQLPVGDSIQGEMRIEVAEAPVTILGMQMVAVDAGDSPQDFSVPSSPPLTYLSPDVPDGGSTSVLVTFNPSAPGSRTAAVVITYDPSAGDGGGTNTVLNVPMTGIGVASSDIQLQVTSPTQVSPPAIDFGAVQLGDFVQQNLTILNTNTYRINIVLGSADGGFDGGPFSVPVSRWELDPNQQILLPVSFVPVVPGDAGATLSVAPCEACTVYPVALTGVGVNGTLLFDPSAVNFGFVLNATQAPPVTVTMTANGNVPITVTNIQPLQNRRTVFDTSTISPPLPYTLQPGANASISFQVGYTPSHLPGGDFDEVEVDYHFGVVSDKGNATQVKYLSLTGNVLPDECHVVVAPSPILDFGTLVPGQSTTQALRMINAGGADCQISSISLNQNGEPAFFIGQPVGDGGIPPFDAGMLVLPAHSELQGFGRPGLPLTFAAPHNSPVYHRSAMLSFASSDTSHPSGSVELTGTLASAYSARSPWPKWAHDNANTGQSEVDTSGMDGGLLWSLSLTTAGTAALSDCAPGMGGYYVNGPIVGSERNLYITGCDGTFYAVDELGGSVNWLKQLQAPTAGAFTAPALAPNDILDLGYGTNTGPYATVDLPVSDGIVALANLNLLNDPGVTCQYPVPIPAYWPPNLAAQSLFYAPFLNFYQIGEATQTIISVQNQDPCNGGPQVPLTASAISLAGDLLYGYTSGKVLDFGPGAQVGQFSESIFTIQGGFVSSLQSASPAIDDDGNSFWCSQGSCVALTAVGLPIWHASVGTSDDTGDFGAPVLGYGQLFVFSLGRTLSSYSPSVVAFDAATGAQAWSSPLPGVTIPASQVNPTLWGNIAGPALTENGLLLVPSPDGLYALNATGTNAGQLAWKLPITDGTFAPPSIGGDGTIFIGTVSQGLLAVDPTTHTVRWSYVPKDSTGAAVSISSSPAIGDFGVFFTADNGFLYGVH